MTLNQLIYFQTVARCQHFRLAASELNISQPSLSHSISNLEEELGIILFERKGRTVTLTKYGKIFLEHTDRILDDVRLAEKHMKKLSGNSGHVDIAYVFPLPPGIFPTQSDDFSPVIIMKISVSVSPDLYRRDGSRTEIRAVRRHLRFLCGK